MISYVLIEMLCVMCIYIQFTMNERVHMPILRFNVIETIGIKVNIIIHRVHSKGAIVISLTSMRLENVLLWKIVAGAIIFVESFHEYALISNGSMENASE